MYTLQQKRPTDGERKQYPSAAGKGGRAGKVGGGGVGQGGEGLLVSPMFESREKGHISTVTGLRLNKDSKDAQQMTTGSARARKRESTKGGRGGGKTKNYPDLTCDKYFNDSYAAKPHTAHDRRHTLARLPHRSTHSSARSSDPKGGYLVATWPIPPRNPNNNAIPFAQHTHTAPLRPQTTLLLG